MNKKKTLRKQALMPNGIPRYVRCYDNGGETCDRYTVLFTGNYRNLKKFPSQQFMGICMTSNPSHPQGVGQHFEEPQQCDCFGVHGFQRPPAIGRKCHLGKRINFNDLPPDCQKVVLIDYRDIWNLKD